jgi:hypothetical protein
MNEFIRIQNKIDSLQHSESRYQLSSIGKELLIELQRIKKEHSEMLEMLIFLRPTFKGTKTGESIEQLINEAREL